MELKSQKELVLTYLRKNKSITSWDAIKLYRITRLASIIHLLRAEGYKIFTAKEQIGDKNWARYVLMKDKP